MCREDTASDVQLWHVSDKLPDAVRLVGQHTRYEGMHAIQDRCAHTPAGQQSRKSVLRAQQHLSVLTAEECLSVVAGAAGLSGSTNVITAPTSQDMMAVHPSKAAFLTMQTNSMQDDGRDPAS